MSKIASAGDYLIGAPRNIDPPLHELYHESSKFHRLAKIENRLQIWNYANNYALVLEQSNNRKKYRSVKNLTLPKAKEISTSLTDSMKHRVSTRDFSLQEMSLQQISDMTFFSAACLRKGVAEVAANIDLWFRSYPSAGGLYPLEIYPALLRVDEVPPVLTHYDPLNHRLDLINASLDVEKLDSAMIEAGQYVPKCAMVLLITAVFERTVVKYRDRAYRFIQMEAGFLGQNLCLSASALGLGTLNYGGYYDDEINAILGVDGVTESVVACIFVGTPSENDDRFKAAQLMEQNSIPWGLR